MDFYPVPLKEMVLARNPRRKVLRLTPITHNTTYENELFNIFRDVIGDWQKWVTDVLIPNYDTPAPLVMDSDENTLFRMLRQQGIDIDNTIIYQTQKLQKWVTTNGAWHTRRIAKTVLNATGVSVDNFLMMRDIESILETAIQRNVALISGINTDVRKQLENIVAESFALRRNKKDFTKAIADAMGTTLKRARFIAGDQQSKLASLLTELRQTQLGFNSYVWRTRLDEKVRHQHRLREGKIFLWSHPPLDGHPGWPVNCRCRAEAYMSLGV